MAASAEPSLLLLLVFSFIFVHFTCRSSSLASELHESISLRSQVDELKSKVSSLESIIIETTQELKSKEESIQNLESIIREKSDTIASLKSENDLLQEQLSMAKLEPTSTSKKIFLGYEEALPHSLLERVTQIQQIVATRWNGHLLPTLEESIRKAIETKDRVTKWFEPHIETLHAKWIPTLKDRWITFTTYLEPQVQSLTIKLIEVYDMSKKSLTPYTLKALNMADGYIQVAMQHADPYIAQVVTLSKPHLDKARVTLEPYTKKMGHAYQKLMKSAKMYHQKAEEMLKTNELTKPVATIELAWFAATALLSLPVIFVIKLLSRISRKHMRQTRKFKAVNGQRRAKRRHPY